MERGLWKCYCESSQSALSSTHVKVPYPPPEQLLTHSRISKSAGPDDMARLLGLVTVTMCVASDRSGRWGRYTRVHGRR